MYFSAQSESQVCGKIMCQNDEHDISKLFPALPSYYCEIYRGKGYKCDLSGPVGDKAMCSTFENNGGYTTARVYDGKDYHGCLSSEGKKKGYYKMFG